MGTKDFLNDEDMYEDLVEEEEESEDENGE